MTTVQPILQKAIAHLSNGEAPQAFATLAEGLKAAPGNPQLLQLMAAAAWQGGDLYAADDALKTLIKVQGDHTPATDLMTAQLCLDLLEFDRARAALDRLLANGKTTPGLVKTAVRLLTWQGETPLALQILERQLGQTPHAADLLALSVTHDPNLTPARLESAENVMSALADSDEMKTRLLFALARYSDKIGDHEKAWSQATQANQFSTQQNGFNYTDEARSAFQKQLKNRAGRAVVFANTLSAPETPTEQNMIYLVGAPRTGSSLLQSILSALPDVDSAGERGAMLPYLNGLCDAVSPTPADDFLTQVQQADLSGLKRGGFTAETVIDKTTHNFFILPLLARTHANAKFVNVVRRPQDVAISMFLHEFPSAFPETCDLQTIADTLHTRTDIAAMYDEADVETIAHNHDAFCLEPSKIGGALSEKLSLDWSADKLAPENRNSAVPTFSAGQVRKPIKPSPADHWKRFEPFMPPQVLETLNLVDIAQRALT